MAPSSSSVTVTGRPAAGARASVTPVLLAPAATSTGTVPVPRVALPFAAGVMRVICGVNDSAYEE